VMIAMTKHGSRKPMAKDFSMKSKKQDYSKFNNTLPHGKKFKDWVVEIFSELVWKGA